MSYSYPTPDTTPGTSPAPTEPSEPLGPAIDLQPSSTPTFEGPANDYPAARVLTYGDNLVMPVPTRFQTCLFINDIYTLIHDTTTTNNNHTLIPSTSFTLFDGASDYRPSPPPETPSPEGTPPPPDRPPNNYTFTSSSTICPTKPASRADAITDAHANCHRHEAPRPA